MLRSARPPRETARFSNCPRVARRPAGARIAVPGTALIIGADPASEKSIQVMDAAAGGARFPANFGGTPRLIAVLPP